MKSKLTSVLILTILVFFCSTAHSQDMCYQDIETQRMYDEASPLERARMDQLRLQAEEFARNFQDESFNRDTNDLVIGTDFIIPVVVHIVTNGGGASQISQLKVERSMDMLNRFFSGKSAYDPLIDSDFVPVRGSFTNKRIKFVLANFDPNGNPTSGVTVNTDATYALEGQDEEMRRLYNWPREKYFNIYVVDGFFGVSGGTSGFATFPFMVDADPEIDGHVMQFWAFGEHDTCYQSWYHNLSHEVGHWLNLYHIWSYLNQSCDFDDEIADTPNTDGNAYQAFTDFPGVGGITTCSTKDNITNMMDYTAPFYAMFTDGQRQRMEAALNSPIAQRNELWQTSNVLATIYGCTTGPDSDGDNIPDACDICPNDAGNDSDNDGVCDSADLCPGLPDVDLDTFVGIPDACDSCHPIINFNDNANSSYDPSEDFGVSDIYDNGATLYISNNGWKAVDFTFDVTPNSVVEFDFKSTIQGEAHFIGFDSNNQLPSSFQYMLHGTEANSNSTTSTTFNTYPANGEWVHYTIPLGADFTGTINRIFFSAENDVVFFNGVTSPGSFNDATSFFRNVKVYDGVVFNTETAVLCPGDGVQNGLGGGLPQGGVYSGDGVTDDGNGMTYSFDPVAAGAGMATLTYTTDDPCLNSPVSVDVSRLVDDGIPVVSCSNVTLTLDNFGMAYYDPLAEIPIIDTLYLEVYTNDTEEFGGISREVIITEDVVVSFDWFFDSYSDDPEYFGYIINGSFYDLTFGDYYGSGTESGIQLFSGDYFGFIIFTDNTTEFGYAQSTITDFLPGFQGQFDEANWEEYYYGPTTDGFTYFESNSYTIPITVTNNCGAPAVVSASQTVFTCEDIGENIVTISANNGIGTGTCDAIVTIVGPTSTWDGTGWDVLPSGSRKTLFNANYNTSVGNVVSCSCEIANGSTLTVDAGGFMDIRGNIKVGAGSTLLVENEGSVRQINDNAIVTNNGTISVLKTTPAMAAKSFMVSGSPMTGETREGVFGPAYIVRNHVTGNFVPNPDVANEFPSANNFADDNGDNWLNHTGGLNPGEGYMVFPQPDGTSSGMYTQTHTLGTLNNGVIDFTMDFNGTQNGSPSMMANPYASAIDAEAFFDHPSNSNIDVVYFWEHLTPLSAGYPGYSPANFNMGDISLYSESLAAGVPAANGGATPTQFIASGQGFGVKPTAGGMAQFNNAMRVTGPNDSYRSSDSVSRDRLWMHVANDTYGLGSTALIGFTENTSDGYSTSEDVDRLPTPVSLYSELETGEELVVNALGTFEVEDAFYLSFTTQVKETQDYRISIQDIDGVNLENASVYLIDSLTGSVTNLTEGDYTFQSGEAVYHKRFKVVFENSVLGINTSNLDMVSLYPNPTQNTVTIVSPQAIVTSATVHDIRGRIVSEVDFINQANYQIDLSTLESALYFIEITTESGTITKRIVKN